ncbi:unnamed protein product [Gongylonema pulchrum]|uniref:G protein-coupled receptor n=1 Tax=Gongylonema pulchrum TaxID=637853 RepID=A0A183DTK6_9BILA|nr:unnamed protein product [Gongylonema pulchrum]
MQFSSVVVPSSHVLANNAIGSFSKPSRELIYNPKEVVLAAAPSSAMMRASSIACVAIAVDRIYASYYPAQYLKRSIIGVASAMFFGFITDLIVLALTQQSAAISDNCSRFACYTSHATRIAIHVLIVEATLNSAPELFAVFSSLSKSIVFVNIYAYTTGVCAPLRALCHPFIFALSHRDFNEILHIRIAQIYRAALAVLGFVPNKKPRVFWSSITGNKNSRAKSIPSTHASRFGKIEISYIQPHGK